MSRRAPMTNAKKVSLKNWAARTGGDYLSQALVNEGQNRVLSGHRVFAPTTSSTQITGAGATTVRVNLDYGICAVGGVIGEQFNAANSADIVVGSASPLLAAGQSIVIAVVLKQASNGTLTIIGAPGTPATTGVQVSPGDDVVQAAVGAGLQWVKLGETTVNRTADTTLTQSYDNTKKDVSLML